MKNKKNRKNRKRIRFLRGLYGSIVKLVLTPVTFFIILNGNPFVGNNLIITLFGWQNVQVLYVLILVISIYLQIFPIYFLLKGLYLFDGNLVHLWNSLTATFKVRYALFRQPTKLDTDRVIRDFNRTVKRATLIVWDDSIELVMPLPQTIEAQKMMDGQVDAIRYRISLIFPKYALSSFERENMTLILIGSRN